MIYLTPVGLSKKQQALYNPARWGVIRNPRNMRRVIPEPYLWALDNDAFKGFDPQRYRKIIIEFKEAQDRCLFVVAPDIIGDPVGTMANFEQWAGFIRWHGWPVAFVAQPGQEAHGLPDCDALFLGGGTDWRFSKPARDLAKLAKARGVHVHVGMVNSAKAVHRCLLMGADSVDGTNPLFAPSENIPILDQALQQYPLLGG